MRYRCSRRSCAMRPPVRKPFCQRVSLRRRTAALRRQSQHGKQATSSCSRLNTPCVPTFPRYQEGDTRQIDRQAGGCPCRSGLRPTIPRGNGLAANAGRADAAGGQAARRHRRRLGRVRTGPEGSGRAAEDLRRQAVIAVENVRLFDEIQDKSRQLELANTYKSRFLAAASHDLRQPLHALNLFAGQLQAESDPSERNASSRGSTLPSAG